MDNNNNNTSISSRVHSLKFVESEGIETFDVLFIPKFEKCFPRTFARDATMGSVSRTFTKR
jgi:hypothetical protein